MDDLRHLIEPELARRQLQLSWHSSIQGTVDVAATETRQIALNLLLNACEASPPGGVSSLPGMDRRRRAQAFRRELSLEVVDAGPGLPAAVASALTEVGVTDPRDPPRGLGIRVVRDLVRGLGGRIVATAAADESWIPHRRYFARRRWTRQEIRRERFRSEFGEHFKRRTSPLDWHR